MRRYAMCAALALATFAPPAVSQAADDAVTRYVKAQMEWRVIPAVNFAVFRKGSLIRSEAIGQSRLEPRVDVSLETPFHLGSIGKQFTAAAVLLLAQDGVLAIDDRVSQHLPDAPVQWRGITIRHLLTHTSGLQNYVDSIKDFSREYTDRELLGLVAAQPLLSAPGASYRYSNSGYLVLGILVQRVSGSHLGAFLADRIFQPLEMRSMALVGDVSLPETTRGYRLVGDSIVVADVGSRALNRTGDGSLAGTIRDIGLWDRALYATFPLTDASKRLAWTSARLNGGRLTGYGFGWSVSAVGSHVVVEHGGIWQGFSVHVARYVTDSLTVVVFTNRSGIGNTPGLIAHRIAKYFVDDLRGTEWPPRPGVVLDSNTLQSYAGHYELGTARMRIWTEGGTLRLSATGRGTATMIPISKSEFVLEADNIRLRFSAGARAGELPTLTIYDGRERRATRLPPQSAR